MTERITEGSPWPSARITGVVYLLYFLTAIVAVLLVRRDCRIRRCRGDSGQHPGARAFISLGFRNRPHRDRIVRRGDGALLRPV